MFKKNTIFYNFIKVSKNILISPKDYFSSLKQLKPVFHPVILSLLYGLTAGIIYFFWSYLDIDKLNNLPQVSIRLGAVIFFPVVAIIFLFINSFIIRVLSILLKGKKDFKMITSIIASLQVMLPVNAFFKFFYCINAHLGFILDVICTLYTFYILYYGLVYTLSVKIIAGKIIAVTLGIIKIVWAIFNMSYDTSSSYIYYNQQQMLEKNHSTDMEAFEKSREKYKQYLKEEYLNK